MRRPGSDETVDLGTEIGGDIDDRDVSSTTTLAIRVVADSHLNTFLRGVETLLLAAAPTEVIAELVEPVDELAHPGRQVLLAEVPAVDLLLVVALGRAAHDLQDQPDRGVEDDVGEHAPAAVSG